MRLLHSCMAAAILSTLGATAYAQEDPIDVDARLSAEFRDPVGTVSATDPIEVWLTIRSVGADPVRFDLSASDPFGMEPSQLPTEGFDESVQGPPEPMEYGSYNSLTAFISRSCDDTFNNGCAPGAYTFNPNTIGSSSWFGIDAPFELNPGASIDILLYTLTPVGGMAAPGTYEVFHMGLGLDVHGIAVDGVTELTADMFTASTCNGLPSSSCAFTRTVVAAVPEPESVAMLLAGLGVLGVAVSRRRKRLSVDVRSD